MGLMVAPGGQASVGLPGLSWMLGAAKEVLSWDAGLQSAAEGPAA